MQDLGRILIVGGIGLLLVGFLFLFSDRLPFGRLPGDFVFRGDNVTVFFPFATMLLVSVVLTIVVNVLFFRNR